MFEHLNRPLKLMMTPDEVLNTKLTIKDLKNKTQNGNFVISVTKTLPANLP